MPPHNQATSWLGLTQIIYEVTCFHWIAPDVPRCACFFLQKCCINSLDCSNYLKDLIVWRGQRLDYLQTFGPGQMKSLLLPGASEGQISNVHGGVLVRSVPSSSDDTHSHQHTFKYVPFDFAACGRGTGGAHIKWLQRRERGSVLILCSQKGSPLLPLITADSHRWCWWCSVPFHPCPSTPLKVDSWGGSLTADMLRSRKWAS